MNTDNLKKEIKKIKIGHVALLCTGIFLAFLIIGGILVAAGGGLPPNDGRGWQWNNFIVNIGPGRSYDVNDHKDLDMAGVDSIAIITVSDDVTLRSGGDKAAASLVGQCRTTGMPVHLEVSRDGGALRIEVKYQATFGFNSSNTRLTVDIPSGFQGNLSISTVSGNVRAEGLPFALKDTSLNTISGDVHFSTVGFVSLKAGTTSGDVTIGNIAAKTTVHTISGSIALDYAEAAETNASTVSGKVKAILPAASDFSVDFGSVSGDFRSTHPNLNVSGADRGFESVKAGAPSIKVNTTSGDFRIEGK